MLNCLRRFDKAGLDIIVLALPSPPTRGDNWQAPYCMACWHHANDPLAPVRQTGDEPSWHGYAMQVGGCLLVDPSFAIAHHGTVRRNQGRLSFIHCHTETLSSVTGL